MQDNNSICCFKLNYKSFYPNLILRDVNSIKFVKAFPMSVAPLSPKLLFLIYIKICQINFL